MHKEYKSCSPSARQDLPDSSLSGGSFILKNFIRCQNTDAHKNHKGNMLIAIGCDAIYIKCRDFNCRRWTKIQLKLPGCTVDLRDAGIVQELLPKDYHLDLAEAITVVSNRE